MMLNKSPLQHVSRLSPHLSPENFSLGSDERFFVADILPLIMLHYIGRAAADCDDKPKKKKGAESDSDDDFSGSDSDDGMFEKNG